MALKVVTMAEMRMEVLLEAERTGMTVSEVCRRYGISRQTYYRYRRRYLAEGLQGLEDRSRRPLQPANQISAELELGICEMRKDHPRWGARRIRSQRWSPKIVTTRVRRRKTTRGPVREYIGEDSGEWLEMVATQDRAMVRSEARHPAGWAGRR